MLTFIDKLNELDTVGIEPLIYMTDEFNVMRDDIPVETLNQKDALKNAPRKDSDYFKVPKVISQGE
jgi:aspartyl-tRNA(Asn)/glutamyl-tRNA(Gln) amidotransferase subunit C